MAYISLVTLPNGSVYDLKDKNAPNMIDFTNAEIDLITGLDDADAEEYSNNIAQDVIENYIGTELCGVNQSVEDAINGLNSSIGVINGKIGNVTLPTTAQTITGAIAEHEGDISTINDNLTYTSESTQHITAGSGITIHGANVVYNEYMVMIRVQCSKTDGTVFATGRSETNPIFIINASLKPVAPIVFPIVTNNTINGVMSNYAYVYIAATGNVIVDIPATNTTAK